MCCPLRNDAFYLSCHLPNELCGVFFFSYQKPGEREISLNEKTPEKLQRKIKSKLEKSRLLLKLSRGKKYFPAGAKLSPGLCSEP